MQQRAPQAAKRPRADVGPGPPAPGQPAGRKGPAAAMGGRARGQRASGSQADGQRRRRRQQQQQQQERWARRRQKQQQRQHRSAAPGGNWCCAPLPAGRGRARTQRRSTAAASQAEGAVAPPARTHAQTHDAAPPPRLRVLALRDATFYVISSLIQQPNGLAPAARIVIAQPSSAEDRLRCLRASVTCQCGGVLGTFMQVME
ncbi:hypothetical protein BDY21DRAFT_365753 [Lineolata rhizophorae]|uniref:Uncharacterized protein n=1 Tax=Lineolata rhizophorae TaxID=578093 RepID=A0A6A6NTQ0_9PEZI|nr:hypothetical protein BDY21DRAFT_365753 [Lineolata rhizophorae]